MSQSHGHWLSNPKNIRKYVDGANFSFCAGGYPANAFLVMGNNSRNIPIDSSPVPVDGRRGSRMEWLKIPTGHRYLTGQLNQIKTAHTALLPRNAVCEFKYSRRLVQPNSDEGIPKIAKHISICVIYILPKKSAIAGRHTIDKLIPGCGSPADG